MEDVPKPDTPNFSFRADVKCYTYMPSLPNFLVGGLLANQANTRAVGTMMDRLEFGSGVTALFVERTALFGHVYDSARSAFGRAPALRCPYLEEDARCGIWSHRNSTCSTWFCKHSRGMLGWEYGVL
jgi:hypothetical protein